MFYAYAFNDVMTFEYLKIKKIFYLTNKKSFRTEIKNIFPCFKILSSRLTKQANKYALETPFTELADQKQIQEK